MLQLFLLFGIFNKFTNARKMNSIKLNDACRICLKQNLKLNWNEQILEFCGLSYKDCYYKYTNLEEFDLDCYPTNLCEICANALKNAHMLFEKALESFNVLRAILTTKTKHSNLNNCKSRRTMQFEILPIEEVKSLTDDKALVHLEVEICSLPLCKTEAATENGRNDSEQNLVNDRAPVEPRHFIDIRNFESSAEVPLEKHFNEISDVKTRKLKNSKNTFSKKRKCPSLEPILNEPCNENLSKLSTPKNVTKKRRNYELLSDTLLEEPINDCDNDLPKSSASKSTVNEINNKSSAETLLKQNSDKNTTHISVLPATKHKKLRKKAFMCSYCSLKMDTVSTLERHEATHNQNRKRTETCPQCGIKLFTKISLNEHMKIHDENRKKNHKCEFCENAFYNRGALNVHRRIHLGLMVKCHICSKEYFRQIDLDKHLLRHSEAPIQKNVEKHQKKYAVQCQHCNKSIVTYKWKAHIAAHLDQPQVKCKICEKNFFARTNCINHLRRFHLKNASEYEDFIYYYDRKTRVSLLMMKQQLSAQLLIENQVP